MIDASHPAFPQLAAFVVTVILSAVLLSWLGRRLGNHHVQPLMWASLAVHLVVGVVLLQLVGLGSSDAEEYHRLASQLAASILDPEVARPSLVEGKEGWVWLLAGMYIISGPAPLVAVAVNASLLSAALLFGAATTSMLFGARPARVSALLYVLSPGHLFWGSLPLREAAVAFLCSTLAYFAVRALQGWRPGWLAVAACLGSLMFVRGSASVLVAGGLAAACCLSLFGRRSASKGRVLPLLAATACVAFALYVFESFEAQTATERIDAVRTSQSAEAASGFDVSEDDVETDLTAATLRSLPRVVAGPFPWESGAVVALLPFAAFWWLVVAFAYRGLKRRVAQGPVLVLTLPAVALFIALAAYSGNYGTMIRLRDQALPFLIPLAATGLARIGTGPTDRRATDKIYG